MRFVCISDLHGAHKSFPLGQLPQGDVLIYAGDITLTGSIVEVLSFDNWLHDLPFRHKIVIAGNHDICLEKHHNVLQNAIYLENDLVEIEGIKIYGSPINATKGFWAFTDKRDMWAFNIPDGLDILITHSPPEGILDVTSISNSLGPAGSHGGCRELTKRLKMVRPKYHIFGHIHEGYGRWQDDYTRYFNVAMQDEGGHLLNGTRLIHEPVVFDLDPVITGHTNKITVMDEWAN